MNRYQKPKPFRSKPYLEWLRDQVPICDGFGAVEAHHVKLLGGGGMGLKPPDNEALPVPHMVHLEIHQVGEKTVLLKRLGKTKAWLRWKCDWYFAKWLAETGQSKREVYRCPNTSNIQPKSR